MRGRTVVSLALLLGACSAPARLQPVPAPRHGAGPLAAEFDALLDDPGSVQAFWGIAISELDGGRVLYERNADRLFMPASNMKLVTTAAALLRLDPDRRLMTRLYASGSLVDGTLQGDLLLVGEGDPTFGGRWDHDPLSGPGDPWGVMRRFAEAAAGAGIRRITGRIIGVDEYFEEEPLGFGWSWDNLAYGYSAPVSALQWNEGTVQVITRPAKEAGGDAEVVLFPDVGVLQLDARVRTTEPLRRTAISIDRAPGSDVLVVRGGIPAGADPDTSDAAVPDPARFAASGLRAALLESGIEVAGPAVDQDALPQEEQSVHAREGSGLVIPQDLVLIGEVTGPRLSELVRVTLKVSQNLFAETLLRLMPAWRSGLGSVAGGRREVEAALTGLGVAPDRYVQRDGSGLSRYNYLSPEVIIRVLRGMDRSPVREAWHASLPVMGVDGTLENRGEGSPILGRVWAKTGYISNSRALSGYLMTARGDTLTFSMLANNFTDPTRTIEYIQDLLCERLLEWGADGR